ncbi:MAG: DUF4825 domain-containing protein [Clostridiales bacterium]|nr:DUF4825 domain-containing protein [Clostridiales bacterium]
MNRELSCYIVRDLLPAYIENLTGEETAADIRAHLAGCPDCSAVYTAMTADEPAKGAESDAAAEREQRSRDIDYLKKVRTGTRRRVLAAVLAALIILAIPLVRYCVIGTQEPAVAYALAIDDTCTELNVEGTALGSSEALAHLSLTQDENGVVTIAPRNVHKLFYRDSKRQAEIKTEQPITKVQDIFGTVYWEDGQTISGLGRYLFTAEIPYVGDASAVMDLLYALDLQNQLCLPDMHIELETGSEPYGMTVYAESPQTAAPALGGGGSADTVMENLFNKYACIILAKVGNLDHVSLKYITKDGETKTFTMSAAEATALTGRPIKEWCGSYADTERLLDTAGITAR